MASSASWSPGPDSSFEQHHGHGVGGLYVKLTGKHPSRLECLAADLGFHYKPSSFYQRGQLRRRRQAESTASTAPANDAIHGSKRPFEAQEPGAGSTDTVSRSHRSTSTSDGPLLRKALRQWRFDLVALGIGSSSSSSASHPPFSQLDIHPAPSLVDPAVEGVFHRRALQVERLLCALDRARDWTAPQLVKLFLDSGGTQSDVEDLYDLFGQDLSADFIIYCNTPIGKFLAKVNSQEGSFNSALDESVVTAANSVLSLINVAGDEPGDDAPAMSTSSHPTDEAAAASLLKATRRWQSGTALRFVNSGAGRARGLDGQVIAAVKPDWLLVSGIEDKLVVYGSIESKPAADPSSLIALCHRRGAPLTASVATDEPPSTDGTEEARPSQSSSSKRPFRRAAPRHCLEEPPELTERQLRERDIMARPFQATEYGFVDSMPWQKLALQLSSQLLAFNVRNGLLWAHWGHDLLPVQLTPASHADSDAPCDANGRRRQYALVFAPTALDVRGRSNPGAPYGHDTVVPSSSAAATTTLGFHGQPNVIMGLVKWALFAEADTLARGRLVPDGEPMPWDGDFEDEEGDEGGRGGDDEDGGGGDEDDTDHVDRDGGGASGKAEKGGGSHKVRGSRVADAQVDDAGGSVPASSSFDSMSTDHSGSLFSAPRALHSSPTSSPGTRASHPTSKVAPAPASPPRSRRTVSILPCAHGGFANVHRGTIMRPGEPDVRCVYKQNRRPRDDLGRPLSPLYDAEEGGPKGRFRAEMEAFEHLSELQGTVLPRLLGTSRVLSEGIAHLPPSIILEDVGEPIHDDEAWPAQMPLEERRRLVEEAFARLHRAGWIHGDVATRNILVSRGAQPGGDDKAATAVRVCLVDLARAERATETAIRVERAELVMLLDDLF